VRITLSNFSGVAPKVSPFILEPNQAQVANNTRLWSGVLEPLPSSSSVKTGLNVLTESIYRFGQDTPGDTNYWFSWAKPVHVVKGPIAGDTTERTYFTGDSYPRVTDNSVALSSSPYPGASYRLGIPAPALAPYVVVNGAASTTEAIETRAYVYTYVSAWGEEGMPSDPTPVDMYPATQTTTITFGTIPTGNYNLQTKRIYRSFTSASGTNYFFVAEVPVAQTTFTDNIGSTSLGESIPSMSWAMPPDDMIGLIALPNGFLAGFKGRDIYFSESYRLHAWPEEYIQSVDYPILGLAQFGQNVVVLTTGSPYMLTGTDPASMTLETLNFAQACVSAKSISRLGPGVVYSSPDGLAYVGPDGMSIITEALFTRKEWQALNPSSIVGAEHDGRYYGFYDTGTVKAGFILDPKSANSSFIFNSLHYTGLYNDLRNDALYGIKQGVISKIEGGTSPLSYTWRSKLFSLPKPTSFSAWQVVAADYASITVKFYLDNVLIHSASVASNDVLRLPSDTRGRNLEIEVTGTSKVVAVHIATSVEELRNV
jgi:hypothetical protein